MVWISSGVSLKLTIFLPRAAELWNDNIGPFFRADRRVGVRVYGATVSLMPSQNDGVLASILAS